MPTKIEKEAQVTLTLAQKGLVLVGIPLLFQLVSIGILSTLLKQTEQHSWAFVHYVLWFGALLNILLAIFISQLFSTGITSRIKLLKDNTVRLAKNEPIIPLISGSDEIADLEKGFRAMAVALAEAEAARKRAEDLLLESEQQRSLIEKSKRDFVSIVSHELRTPLTAIHGSLTLLAVGALGPMSENAIKSVKIAERNSQRLVNLINDLLDIDKLEAGKINMVFAKVKLAQVIERSIENARQYANQNEITFDLQVDDKLEVCADSDRISQVLTNLISNACKYSAQSSVVQIKNNEDDDLVTVSVTDKGQGIPAESIGQIFECFHKIDSADSKRKRGTGLSLAICKTIIEQHRGKIGVNSEYGQGSTFWFCLPKRESPNAPELSEQPADLKKAPENANCRESDKSKIRSANSTQEI